MVFKPGETTNPEGNNGRTPITDSLRVILSRSPDDPLDDKPQNTAQEIALQWAKKARAGELAAITTLTDRVEGKVKEKIEHSGSISLPELVARSISREKEVK